MNMISKKEVVMDQEKIGKFIKDIRKKNKLTQKDLADKLGVTFQAVSKWENGKNVPDISLLKEISNLFDVNLDDIIDGEIKEKKEDKFNKKNYFYFGGILIVFILIIIFTTISGNNHDFEFKQISTSCNNFNLTGSMAYNKDKTSLYISSIEFCGEDDNEIYKSIGCTLYEEHEGMEKEISSCNGSNDITLEDYLKNVKISVDNYEVSCSNMVNSEIYLEINATLDDNKEVVYKIPITLVENSCK